MLKRLVLIGYDFGRHMSKKNISSFAASTAFFLFLSLIPALMLLCSIIPYTPLTEANLMSAATEISPDAMNSLLINIIRDVYDKSVGLVSASAIITLWSAGKGMLALMRGLNAVNAVEESRSYVVQRMVACLYTVLMLVAVILSLLVMVFGKSLVGIIVGIIPQTTYLFDLLIHFRTLLMWAVLTVVIALLYTYVPGTRLGFQMQLPGAVFAAVAWSVMTWAFSVYIDEFNGFNTYGSLTTIIILMLWLYTAMYIILAGAYINRYFKPAFQFFVGKKHIDRKEKIG